jgi:hypothetical protein
LRLVVAGGPSRNHDAAAQHAREVRDDLHVLDTFHAIATIHGGASYAQPVLRAVLDALRPRSGREIRQESPAYVPANGYSRLKVAATRTSAAPGGAPVPGRGR